MEQGVQSDGGLSNSQWVSLGEIVGKMGVPRADALRKLLHRNLGLVRPARLTIGNQAQTVVSNGDASQNQCIRKVLTPKCDWHTDLDDDPNTATVQFQVTAFLEWLSKTDIKIDVEDLRNWTSIQKPLLESKGLVVQLSGNRKQKAEKPVRTQSFASANIVTEARLAEMTGYTHEALATMRRRGKVSKNEHWFKSPNGRIAWNIKEFEKWQMNENLQQDIQGLKYTEIESEYESRSVGNGSERPRIRRRRRKD